MKLRYTGPSGSGVDVIHPDPAAPDANTVTHCPPGEVVELPDELAKAQLDTGLFERAGKSTPTASAPATGEEA